MASKRHLRRKSCEGKRRLASEAEARAVAFSLHCQDGAQMTWYRCDFCRSWHVGHTRKEDRQAGRGTRFRG